MPRHVLQSSVLIASASAVLVSLDTSVNIAFPAITTAFGLDVTAMQWVVVSYVLTYASLLLGCGKVADVWGHRRVLSWGLIAISVALLLCGLAPTFPLLLGARIVQGIAVALIFAAAPALATLSVPPPARGRVLGIFQMSAAVGFALGPLVGGLLVGSFGWRAVYLFRVVPALVLGWWAFRQTPAATKQTARPAFDALGMLSLASGIAGLLLAMSRGQTAGWHSPLVLTLLGLSGLSFALFVKVESTANTPVVDLGLFRRPAFTLANALNVLANGAMFAIWLLVPHYTVQVLGHPETTAGLVLVATPLATALVAPLAGALTDRIGTRLLSSVGLGLEACGLWLMSTLSGETATLPAVLTLGLVGAGVGLFQVPNMSFVMGAIPRDQQGVAGGMSQMMRTLGVVLGVTGASTLFASRKMMYAASGSGAYIDSFMPAFQDVFLVCAGVCLCACVLSVLRRGAAD